MGYQKKNKLEIGTANVEDKSFWLSKGLADI